MELVEYVFIWEFDGKEFLKNIIIIYKYIYCCILIFYCVFICDDLWFLFYK